MTPNTLTNFFLFSQHLFLGKANNDSLHWENVNNVDTNIEDLAVHKMTHNEMLLILTILVTRSMLRSTSRN